VAVIVAAASSGALLRAPKTLPTADGHTVRTGVVGPESAVEEFTRVRHDPYLMPYQLFCVTGQLGP